MKNKRISLSSIKRVLGYIKRYRLLLILSILLASATVILSLYIPIIIGQAIDLLATGNGVPLADIFSLLLRSALIALSVALLEWVMNNVNNKITYNVTRDVRNEAFDKIEKLPLSYIDTHSHGDILSRLISDIDQLAEGLLLGFTQFFTGIMTILATLVFMFSINAKIALVVVLLTPLSLFVASFISRSTHSLFKKQSEERANQTSIINESIGNMKVVKAFSHEDEALDEFDEANKRLVKASLRATFFSSLVNPTTRFVNALVYASVALMGALCAMGELGGATIGVGALSCFLSYANQYAKPFNEISSVVTELQNSLACANRVFELIESENEPSEAENARVLTDAKGVVDFDNISFSYTKERELIKNINLHIEAGKHVAIVGPTGCGKTTLINLLMRFYDVNSGAILVDGTDIKDMTRQSLRKNYGMVLQDTWLQNATVLDNIRMGKPNASYDEVLECAKASYAHSFIKRLPNGYDTVVSNESSPLSQGQRQLISISRIMLSLPPILILDEATSSIDTRTEIKIQEAFARLMKGRTSFIVAHRLSTIKDADIILVMKDGNIIETGNHTELLARRGFYYELYNSMLNTDEELK